VQGFFFFRLRFAGRWLCSRVQASCHPDCPAIDSRFSLSCVRPSAFIAGEKQLFGRTLGVSNSPSNVFSCFKFLLPIFISFYLKSFFSHPEMIPPEGDLVGNIAFAF